MQIAAGGGFVGRKEGLYCQYPYCHRLGTGCHFNSSLSVYRSIRTSANAEYEADISALGFLNKEENDASI